MILAGHIMSSSVFLLMGGLMLVLSWFYDSFGVGGLFAFPGIIMAALGGGILGLGFLWQHLFA